MYKVLSLIALIFSSASALAGDDEHLVPEASIFSEYYPRENGDSYADYEANVLKILAGAFDKNVFARAVVFPSFQHEYALAIEKNENEYKIVYLVPSVKIWLFEELDIYKAGRVRIVGDNDGSLLNEDIQRLEEFLPPSLSDVRVERCERIIPGGLGEKLHFLWGEMLFRTRYTDQRPLKLDGPDSITVGADGVTYHFSFEHGYERLTGKIWSPDEGSVTGKFVAITEMLRGACHAKNGEATSEEIERRIDGLMATLSEAAY